MVERLQSCLSMLIRKTFLVRLKMKELEDLKHVFDLEIDHCDNMKQIHFVSLGWRSANQAQHQ
jgi:hypothetical protein